MSRATEQPGAASTSPSRVRIEVARGDDATAIRAVDGLGASTKALLERDLGADDRCCLVARVVSDAADGPTGVVGFASGSLQLDEGHVLDVAVDPIHRRRGVGRLLLTTLFEQLAERGATAMTLEVRPSNQAARDLYRQLGFREEGRRPRYYPDGEDALILWRRGEVA